MKVLALELSSARGSLAFVGDEGEVHLEWPNDRKNSASFFRNLTDVRKQCGLPDMIIVGLGPGSYAGTRIAISAAIGLQAASRVQLVGFPSICAISSPQPYCVIGDARRQTFFFARIDGRRELSEGPLLMTERELQSKLRDVEAAPVFSAERLQNFQTEIRFPSARVLAALALEGNHHFVLSALEPIYLREPHITMPKPIQL